MNRDWAGGAAVFHWPLYSGLIALTAQCTGLTPEYAAHFLNALLWLATLVAFLELTREAGGNKTVLVWAALTFLLHPQLNEFRSNVSRDVGYWPFYLLSLLLFLRYYRNPCWTYAWGWGMAAMVASLFRLEGLVILFFLPSVLLLRKERWTTRLKQWLTAMTVPFLMVVSLLALFALFPAEDVVSRGGRLFEPLHWFEFLKTQISTGLADKAGLLAASVLNKYSTEWAMLSLLAVLFTLLVGEIVNALSLPYVFFAGHAFYRRLFPRDPETKSVVGCAIGLNVLMLSLFLILQFFLVTRYVTPLALVLMLAVAFSLHALYERWQSLAPGSWSRTLASGLAAVVLLYQAVDGLYSTGPSKQYLKEAGLWLKEHSPPGNPFYSDSSLVAFYAGKENGNRAYNWQETRNLLENKGWTSYDYLALWVKRKDRDHADYAVRVLGQSPDKIFDDGRDNRLLIFRIRHP
jgi:hypothetical protein